MKRRLILQQATTYLLPLLLLFSVFILLRGHYLPGGGFIGGLIASIAVILYGFANGIEQAQKFVKYHPAVLMPVGLGIAVLSGFIPVLFGKPFMTGIWLKDPIPVIGLLGNPLMFDIGVYFVVIGVTLTIIFTIAESI